MHVGYSNNIYIVFFFNLYSFSFDVLRSQDRTLLAAAGKCKMEDEKIMSYISIRDDNLMKSNKCLLLLQIN